MHLTTLFIASLTTGALAVNLKHRALTTNVKRQFSDPGSFPSQCASQCQSVSNQVQSCSTDNCLCTSSLINALAACLQCAGNLVGDAQAEQASLDSVVQACAEEGFGGLPDPTLTGGGGGGGSIPTTGGSGTAAAPTLSFQPTGSSGGTPATTAGGGTTTSPSSNNPLGGKGAAVRVGASSVWSVVVLAVGATFGAAVL